MYRKLQIAAGAKLTDQELVEKTQKSIKSATLPTGLPVPREITRASNALVDACNLRLNAIVTEIRTENIKSKKDLETIEDLEEERKNMRNLLIEIDVANTKPKRTWEEFWADNAALCALVKPNKAMAYEIGRLLIQAIVITAVAAALAFFVFPPLGMILAALVISTFCAYKLYSAGNAIGKAWGNSNENLAKRQLDQGQSIKDKHQQMLQETLAGAKAAQIETKAELDAAHTAVNKESELAKQKTKKLTEELDVLLNEKKGHENALPQQESLVTKASNELAVLESEYIEIRLKLLSESDDPKVGAKLKQDLNAKETEISIKKTEITTLKERSLKTSEKIKEYKNKIENKKAEITLAEKPYEKKKDDLKKAENKHTDALGVVTAAQKAIQKLTPTLSPLAKVSAPPNINPATGRAMPQNESKGYQQGYTKSKGN